MSEDLSATLHRHFGFSSFRPGQAEAVGRLLAGQHTLVVMPTGAGKSLIYQLAALLLPGVTLVISPLIALMKDQVDALGARGIPATFINSSLPTHERDRRLQALAEGALKLVYVAPERLHNMAFQQALKRARIGLLAVDEAHCISQWGHDFRPDYLQIGPVREDLGCPVTAALTATATPRVQDDIVQRLGLVPAQRIVTGFNRPNLCFEVRYSSERADKYHELRSVLRDLKGGGAIVYTGTRADSEEVADFCRGTCEVEAEHYHAGLDADERSRVQDAFIGRRLPVVAATNAFGMGIDRSDVRLVAHFSMPGTLEAYYQEAGRAGRDGAAARAVLLYAPKDRALQEWFIDNSTPSVAEVRGLFSALHRSGEAEVWATLSDLSAVTGLHEVKARVGLAQLVASGAVGRLGDDGPRMGLRVGGWNEEGVREAAANADAHRRNRRAQLADMVAYAESNACRRRILLEHFGDTSAPDARRCCDNCEAVGTAAPQGSRSDVDDYSPAERAALIILDAVRRMRTAVGLHMLAKFLTGSRARDIRSGGYDKMQYYGKLAGLRHRDVQEVVIQLQGRGMLKTVGGEYPVLGLTPSGEAALAARARISMQATAALQPESLALKKAEQRAGGTVGLSGQMLAQGMSPAQVAEQRGLGLSTIFGHAAWLISSGELSLERVVSHEVVEQVQAAIHQVGDVSALAPIKVHLPESITYGEIRCVVAAGPQKLKHQADARGSPTAGLIARIVKAGNDRSGASVDELVGALAHQNGNVRRLAASALGKIGDGRAVPGLMAVLERESLPQVRQYAVKALGEIGDPRAREVLERISADVSERDYVQKAASLALRRLGVRQARRTDVTEYLAQARPRPLKGPWDAGWALGFHSRFEGSEWQRTPVGELAYRLKYQGDRAALGPLVEQAIALCRDHPELARVDAVGRVPSTQKRPFDPLGKFTESLASRLFLPVRQLVLKTRATQPQKDMTSLAQKQANVAGAFVVQGAVRGGAFLIVDDLYDSGATLAEICRVLRAAGARVLSVLTLTRTIHTDA